MGMRTWLTRIVALLLLGYVGMFALALFDGGASKGMPSASAEGAERSGTLDKRLTVLIDSGGPPGVHDAWIEIPAATAYRFGAFPHRVPLRYYGEGTRYLLSVALPDERIEFGDSGRGSPDKQALGRDGAVVVAWDIVGPVADTIIIRARRPGQRTFPVYFSDGRSVADAAPPRP